MDVCYGGLGKRYRAFKKRGRKIDLRRGRPCREQLNLSNGLWARRKYTSRDGIDCRNYQGGLLSGLPEARELFSEYLEVSPDEVIVGDNSSTELMHETLLAAITHGVPDGKGPWDRSKIAILCPCPGYDRHFARLKYYGIKMIPVAITDEGPDMGVVETWARNNTVKGILCVPRYSNPTGITYSDAVVQRLANMRAAAPDFRIFWDNAYAVHHLEDDHEHLANILEACKRASNPNRVLLFGSTSKITFAGAGIAAVAGSKENIEWFKKDSAIRKIGPNLPNQLWHVRFLRDMDGIRALMRRHAAILRPKRDALLGVLERELRDKGIVAWTHPKGGAFIYIHTKYGRAKETVRLARDAGLALMDAGSCFPYGVDSSNSGFRIPFLFPTVEAIEYAAELLTVCIQLASR